MPDRNAVAVRAIDGRHTTSDDGTPHSGDASPKSKIEGMLPRNAAGDVQFIPPAGYTKWPPVDQWQEDLWSAWLTQHGWTPEQIAQYLDHDRFAYGVGFTPAGEQAHPHNAYEAGVKWLYKPTPQGVTLHATRDSNDVSNILWGGSAGGTKSYSGRWEIISGCLFTQRDDFRAIITRRELEELRRTHLDDIQTEARRINDALGDKNAVKVTAQPPVAVFDRTGAKIVFGHCKDANDHEKYLSDDYDIYHGDEAVQMLWKQIVGIQGRVRNDTKINRIGRMILTTNPGGPCHDELDRYFIKKDISAKENKKYKPEQYQFIQASLFHNPFYLDSDGTYETYITRLWMYDEDRRRQLLDGDWSVVANKFFDRFNPDLHVHKLAI
jgi:hypothetical protein